MRARSILSIALFAFIILAVVTIAKQANEARLAASKVSASAMPLAEAAPQAQRPEPSSATVTSAPIPAPVPAIEATRIAEEATERRGTATKVTEPRSQQMARPSRPATPQPPVQKVVAMYFHGNVRCATCRKVEAYAREAVESGFQPQIEAGVVEFRAVNVEQAENRHFIDDFQLVTRSVVVTDEADGVVQRFVKLDNVWGLVGNHDAYLAYVQDTVRGYLETR